MNHGDAPGQELKEALHHENILVIALILLVGGSVSGTGGGYLLYAREKNAAATTNSVQTDAVERRTIEQSVVVANGKVSSNRDVDIKCCQASGSIMTLPYTDVSTAEVRSPGAMFSAADPKDEEPALRDTAQAVVEADQARLKEAQLALADRQKMARRHDARQRDSAAARLRRRQGRLMAHSKADRTKQLFDGKLESQEDLDTDETSATQADADVQTAKAAIAELDQQKIDVDTKEQQIKEMEAAIKQDQTRLKTAQQNLEYCTVTAPVLEEADKKDPPRWFISAMLTNISTGYIVQSGTSGFSAGTTIMTLSDLSHIYVLASVAESDIGQVIDPNTGTRQKVRITVDAYRDEIFEGEVVRVATIGVTASNVTTFEVKIEVTSDNRMKLKPQMTATASIICESRPSVLAIPVSAFSHEAESDSTQPSSDDPHAATATAASTESATGTTTRSGRHGREEEDGSGDVVATGTRRHSFRPAEGDRQVMGDDGKTVSIAMWWSA